MARSLLEIFINILCHAVAPHVLEVDLQSNQYSLMLRLLLLNIIISLTLLYINDAIFRCFCT